MRGQGDKGMRCQGDEVMRGQFFWPKAMITVAWGIALVVTHILKVAIVLCYRVHALL